MTMSLRNSAVKYSRMITEAGERQVQLLLVPRLCIRLLFRHSSNGRSLRTRLICKVRALDISVLLVSVSLALRLLKLGSFHSSEYLERNDLHL